MQTTLVCQSLQNVKLSKKEAFKLPALPTTTIGSFPQTKEVRAKRFGFTVKVNCLKKSTMLSLLKRSTNGSNGKKIFDFDVLVHGEFERNDMVEYFGQNLSGYLFSKNGWGTIIRYAWG